MSGRRWAAARRAAQQVCLHQHSHKHVSNASLYDIPMATTSLGRHVTRREEFRSSGQSTGRAAAIFAGRGHGQKRHFVARGCARGGAGPPHGALSDVSAVEGEGGGHIQCPVQVGRPSTAPAAAPGPAWAWSFGRNTISQGGLLKKIHIFIVVKHK